MSDATPQGKTRNDEDSDLFSVRSYQSGTAIPKIEKVPLTKEEIRKRILLRIMYGVIAAATVASGIWLYLYLAHLGAVKDSVHAASDDGRVESIRAALAVLESDDDAMAQALRLRLRSMLVLAGEAEGTEPIASALEALPSDDDDVARERGIATTYLALARGTSRPRCSRPRRSCRTASTPTRPPVRARWPRGSSATASRR